MDWLFLSLLGASALAVTGVIDKFILGRYVRDPLAYLAALVVMQQILIVAIPAYLGWGFVFPQTLYALAAGSCQVVLWAAYLLALQVEETSRVAALVYVFPVFVFLGAYLFLGETLAAKDYAGGALLVCSAFLVSYRPAQGASPAIFSPAIKYMAVFWVFTAAYALVAKYLLAFMSEWHLILWSSLGSLLAVLPLLGRETARREFAAYFRGGPFLLLALFADEILDFLGRGAFIFAYALGSVALVSSVAALQPFITLVYVILLGLFVPGILPEELDRKTMALKTVAIFLIVVGVYLVS
ncbi:MAG TPA: EamA family transporter [Methanothrix sp.]|nr:EamA family transporter [Methanothrix sp.]